MITLQDQVVEARRELALRRKLYPKWVKRGDLTESEAVYFIKAQEAIIATPRQLDMCNGLCEFHELMRLRERSIKHLQPFFTLKNATGDIICCDRVDFYTN